MRLSVGDSSDLSFVVSSYNTKCTSAKTLASRFRNALTPCKDASDLKYLSDHLLPLTIERKLRDLYRRIDAKLPYGCQDSILSVSWVDETAQIPREDIDDGVVTSRDEAPSSSRPSADTVSDGISPPLSENGLEPNIVTSALFERLVNRRIGSTSEGQPLCSFPRANSERICINSPAALRGYQSVDDFTNPYYAPDKALINNYYKTSDASTNSSTKTVFRHRSLSFDNASSRPSLSGIQMLGQLCIPDFIARGCSAKDIAPSINIELAEVLTTPRTISQKGLNDDISEDERVLFSSLCRVLRGMVLFIDESANHELHWLDLFDSTMEDVIGLLDGIVSDSGVMMKNLKQLIKGYSSTYSASIMAYEKALSRFQKFEKSLEISCTSGSSTSSDQCDPLNCDYPKCPSKDPEFDNYRRTNKGAMRRLLNNPKDFIRYTNYIEQMCLAHHMYDNLEKNRDHCAKGLTEILASFAQHYPRAVYYVEVQCLEKLSGMTSILLENVMGKSRNLAYCYYQMRKIPTSGVIDLHYSVNVNSPNMKDRLHSTIVECFESMRTLSKKLSQLHGTQLDRFSRFTSRYPLKLCGSDLNALFKSYYKYNKHMYTIWWSIYTTIATIFPKNVATSRKVKDTSNPIMGVFVEIKMPLSFLHNLLKHFVELLEIASNDTFAVCSTALHTCAEYIDWSTFVTSLASESNLDPGELHDVMDRLQQDTLLRQGSDIASLDTLNTDDILMRSGTDDSTPLVDLANTLPTCECSPTMSRMLSVVEHTAKALVDYEETDHDFRFSSGEIIHVRIAGNTPLWYGHTISGVDRWFPAKFVRPLVDFDVSLFRRADLECYTYLDCYRLGSPGGDNQSDPSTPGGITLTSKSTLKQALMLSKLGLDGKVEHEFKCALCRKIVLRGTLYLTKTHLGFISSFNDATLFGTQTTLAIPVEDISVCQLTSSKALSFYVRLVLHNKDTHTFYSVRYARRIRDAIIEMANLDNKNNEDNNESPLSSGTRHFSNQLKEAFGNLEPLSKSLPPVNIQMSLRDYFICSLSDNLTPGCRLADTRIQQRAYDFDGDLEPVEFNWDEYGVQIHRRQIRYNFKLKEGKYTALLPRYASGCAREDLKYALVDLTHLMYESVTHTSNIPYSNYFYTIIRITATAMSQEAIVVKVEYDVKFVKSTLLASIITGEACERLANSGHMLLHPSDTDCLAVSSTSKSRPPTGSFNSTLSNGITRNMRSFTWLCIAVLVIYTSLLSGWK
ncbi:GRAM domain-containing protein [Babesia ovis]|uniref:GRAM domain-containing protein n=1 Tax=Babesia ovis TaxID=5869 RepID=A0A9W5TD07_BABOV|nr:GRAM domain-containing protein [Babesia ovis]